ncbi:Ig-like domain-containing protein [Pseudaestuariivita atlantica]|uniref:Ig-like domain-containing protein n=1 Tax=Pseudaestuariivita atlantica TaxID=1317121 RepID=UPI00067C4D8D|nr:Hint domain-containing protein [Pseudaestuariivita atlantica]
MADLILDWGLFGGGYGSVINGTNTVDTGGVAVTVDVVEEDEYASATTFNGEGYVAGGEPFDPFSGLKLFGQGGEGGVDNTSTTTMTFASTDPMFTDNVQNVSFRISDIDGGMFNDIDGGPSFAASGGADGGGGGGGLSFLDIVTVRAYDAMGNLVPVSLTEGADVTNTGGTLTGSGDGSNTDPDNSVLVNITGPVARIEIDYDNGDTGEQGVLVSDVHFSTVDTDDTNEAPVAVDDFATTTVGEAVTVAHLLNDTDADGDTLTTVGVVGPANGTIALSSDTGSVTYTPNPGYVGSDSFTYTVSDGNGGTDMGTVNITVNDDGGGGGNTPPVANPDDATTPEATTVQIFVLGNDTDADGDTLTITSATSTDGTVTIDAGTPNSVFFTPNAGFTGIASLTYEISDGNGGTATSTVSIDVTDVNQPPMANDDTGSGATGAPITVPVLANDTDPDGDTLTITSATSADGTVVIEGGSIVFTSNAGFTGPATVVYTIDDGNGGTDMATVTINVGAGPLIDADILTPVGGGLDAFAGTDEDPDPTDDQDTETGTAGADVISTGDDADLITGGGGDDTLDGGIDNDTVFGNVGNDLITDPQGADSIDGGQGDDTILAGVDTFLDDTDVDNPILTAANVDFDTNTEDGRDFVMGGRGNDSIVTGDDDDTIDGGADNDFIDAGIDDDSVDGATGDDTILGGHGNDTIDGSQGDDLITAGIETTSSVITNGIDLAQTDDVDINDANDRDLVLGGAGDDTITTGDDDDSIDGGADDDLIDAGIDEDTVFGGSGNDTITGGQGRDSLTGGDDRDVFIGGNEGDFVDGSEGGDDFDTLDLTGSAPTGGSLNITYTSADREDGFVRFKDADGNQVGEVLNFVEIENVIPCFTPGTVIATPLGERLVEDLREGDRIITRDNGLQEIRWVGKRELTGHELARNPHLRPILIQAGSLGPNLPEQDILVSPNHRMLVSNDKTALYFEESEVLVAAKHLTGLDGVDEVGTLGVTYMHFLFDRHEVVLSNGAWTESFQPGDYTLSGMGNSQRNEIFELFPELETTEGLKDYAAARRTLKKHEAKLLVK